MNKIINYILNSAANNLSKLLSDFKFSDRALFSISMFLLIDKILILLSFKLKMFSYIFVSFTKSFTETYNLPEPPEITKLAFRLLLEI